MDASKPGASVGDLQRFVDRIVDQQRQHSGPPWPYEQVTVIERCAADLERNMNEMDVLATLRVVSTLSAAVTKIAGDVVEIAAKQTKLTQKQVAEALDVPPRWLQGWRS